MSECRHDTDNDGNCALCHNRGGCKAIGGPFPVRSILDAIRDELEAGSIDIHEAAKQLHCAGWINSIDTDKALRILERKVSHSRIR